MASRVIQRMMDLPDPIAFSDLAGQEKTTRDRLQGRLQQLSDAANKRTLTAGEQTERREIEQKLLTDDVVDPLFIAIRQQLTPDVGDHKQGLLPSQQVVEALQSLKHSGSGRINQLAWPKIVELAGLQNFDADGSLAKSLPGLFAAGPKIAPAALQNIAGLFDAFVASLGGSPDPVAAQAQADQAREALAVSVEKAGNIGGKFGTILARAIRQQLIVESESLVDWMLSLSGAAATMKTFSSDLTDHEKMLAAVFGLLENDQVEPPVYHLPLLGIELSPDEVRTGQKFGKALFGAQGEYITNIKLFSAVLPILVTIGGQGPIDSVSALEWAAVVRYLVARGIDELEGQLARRVDEALNNVQNVGDDQQPSQTIIDLPDLEEETTDFEIIGDNIMALQPAYFAAMFEDLKVFQVVEKLVELFQNGVLPIGRGEGGNSLFRYWKEAALRVSESERRSFYARTLGVPGGDDGGMPNREFSELWMRFVSAVSSYIRQNNIDDLLRSRIPGAISQQMVRKAGRDLATNLSLHGYGMAYFMATELQKQVKDVMKILSDPDIRNAYGARDMWQVIDQVATLELGGAKNSVRYRTMAASGAIILAWLSQKARALSSTSFGPILDITQIQNPSPRPRGTKATIAPTDYDLVNACEQWLAVTGTQEEQVEGYAQPKETPAMTSKPIQIPAIARDLLDSVGVPSLGLSTSAAAGGNGYGYSRR